MMGVMAKGGSDDGCDGEGDTHPDGLMGAGIMLSQHNLRAWEYIMGITILRVVLSGVVW